MKNRLLTESENDILHKKAALRLERMPLQYIIGEWDFCGLTMKMSHSPSVFIPRPETEDLVSIAGELIHLNKLTKSVSNSCCFEIGCGSGAISLALLKKHEKVHKLNP